MAFEIEYNAIVNYSPEEGETVIIIPDGVDAIEESVFANCNNIVSVFFPETIGFIGWSAFEECANLQKVIFSQNTKRLMITDFAFMNCKNLKECILPECEELEITPTAFGGCASLESFMFDNALYLGSENNPVYALMSSVNNDIHEVTLHEDTKIIANYAFRGCEELTEVKIPKGVKMIGKSAFQFCRSLKDLIVPEGVRVIGERAFDGCYGLETIELPSSLKRIEESAFNLAGYESVLDFDNMMFGSYIGVGDKIESYLKKVNYNGTNEQFDQMEIEDGNDILKERFGA